MPSPLERAVSVHMAQGRANFHMPGHKGRTRLLDALQATMDVTELPDTGSLFDAQGAPREAERLAAAYFHTADTLFSAGGCTLCIQAMLQLAAPNGGKVITGRVMHRSAMHAMALLHIEPVYVYPDQSAGFFAGRVNPADVQQALAAHPDAKAVYVTSPDYYGVMSDIRAITRVAEPYGVPVLVDNAHGAHLYALEPSRHPLACGAAMSADSAHKTLPVLTGGAWLQLARDTDAANARDAMTLFGSTSPSFPVLTSLDLCRDWLEHGGEEKVREAAHRCMNIKAYASGLGFLQPQGRCDPLHIALSAASMVCTGEEAGEILRRHGVEPEYAGADGVILMASAENTPKEFDALQTALEQIPRKGNAAWTPTVLPRPKSVLSPGEALRLPAQTVPVRESAGRIAAQSKCPCPPAIPVVMPGERLDADTVRALERYCVTEIKVVKI